MKTKIPLLALALLILLPMVNGWGVGYVLEGNVSEQRVDLRSGDSQGTIILFYVRPYPDYIPDPDATITVNCSWGSGFSEQLGSQTDWVDSGFYVNGIRTGGKSDDLFDVTWQIDALTTASSICDISLNTTGKVHIFITPYLDASVGGSLAVDLMDITWESFVTAASYDNPYATPSAALDQMITAVLDLLTALFDLAKILIIFVVFIVIPLSGLALVWRGFLFFTGRWL